MRGTKVKAEKFVPEELSVIHPASVIKCGVINTMGRASCTGWNVLLLLEMRGQIPLY